MTKKEHEIAIINKIIDLNELLLAYNKTLTNDKEIRKGYNKFGKQCIKAREYLPKIKHEDVIHSIYKNLILGKEAVYTLAIALLNHKKTKFFDTAKGHKEFVVQEKEYYEKLKLQQEQAAKNKEIFEKAKQEGKKVEYLMKDGKMQPVIVDNLEN